MTILHVTDFHFNKRWFDWLLHRAPAHHVVVMSGDLLDLSSPTPHRQQIEWVSNWLNDFPRPICVCSGNHDLEWDSKAERWMPAYWLRDLVNPGVWTDGQRVELNGISFLNIGATTRPKGADADVWVVHAPPSSTLVGTHANGADAGDRDLVSPARRFAPRLVLSGHVHHPLHWRDRQNETLFLNPGHSAERSFPNHILIRTDPISCQFFSAPDEEVHDREFLAPSIIEAEDTIATTAVA
ncbi:MAG TPA: metallophosphoesterase [Opitutus sp.]|nr:metallophosphoesterase [Opitutus sp.]